MITITELAVKKIKALMDEDSKAQGLRVYIKGGGCSGYSYGMLLEESTSEDDTVVTVDGVRVIIDPQSAPLLQGSVIDYSDTLQGAGFQVKNPQAKTTCGCGSSFSA